MRQVDRFGKGRYCIGCGKYISNLKKHIRRDRCKHSIQHRRKV